MNVSSVFALAVIAIQIAAFIAWTKKDKHPGGLDVQSRVTAARDEGLSSKIAHAVASPVAQTASISRLATSPSMKLFREKVAASGKFGGEMDVYLTYQIASMFIGSTLAACGLLLGNSGLRIFAVAAGAYISIAPYSSVKSAAAKAEDEATDSLPEFVDLLQIGLAGGLTLQRSLRFATENLPNNKLIQENIGWLNETLDRGAMTEVAAYTEAGRRIGSTEASALFATLGQAAVSGAPVSETIDRQAKNLRALRHQRRREQVKKVPNKMVVAFILFFLPVLFIVMLTPIISSLGSL